MRMHRALLTLLALAALAGDIALVSSPGAAQDDQYQFETTLDATRRVFAASAGAGLRAIRRGPGGNYYILTAPAPFVGIYDATGKRVGQVPSQSASATKGAALVYGVSFDVDADGRVAVADRGTSQMKLYNPDGTLAGVFSATGAASVALLPGGEVAVTTPNGQHLVTVYDFSGKFVRDYGDPAELSDDPLVNRQANTGEIVSDPSGNNYFAFDYFPEPTMRKFDRAGYLVTEISLNTIEFEPEAQAARRELARTNGPPELHRILNAIAVDPENEDVWLASGTLLMHFDKDGMRLASFRTYMPGGGRLEPSTILIEPNRLLMGADPYGIFEFHLPQPPK